MSNSSRIVFDRVNWLSTATGVATKKVLGQGPKSDAFSRALSSSRQVSLRESSSSGWLRPGSSLHTSHSSGDLLILIMHALHNVFPGLAPFHVIPVGTLNQHGTPFKSQAEVWVCPKWHGQVLPLIVLAFFGGGMLATTKG